MQSNNTRLTMVQKALMELILYEMVVAACGEAVPIPSGDCSLIECDKIVKLEAQKQ